MNTIKAYPGGQTAELPSNWSEMTPEQVCSVFRLNDTAIRKGWSARELKIRILFALLDIRLSWRYAFRPVPERLSENVTMLCERCLGFLFEEGQLSYDDVSNPLPVIGRLIGPADLLTDLTFGEFRHASTALNAFFKSRSVADLDRCITFLYRTRNRKANRAGRKVVGFDDGRFSDELRKVSKLATWQKNLILAWFSSCLNYLQTGSISIDGEDIQLSLLFPPDAGGKQLPCTWNDLLLQVAKDGTIGNSERVDEEPFVRILQIMWSNYKEAKRYEKIAKAHSA